MITNTTSTPTASQLMRMAQDIDQWKLRRQGYTPLTECLGVEEDAEFIVTAIRDARRNGMDCAIRKVTVGVVQVWQR